MSQAKALVLVLSSTALLISGCDSASNQKIAATVNGTPITEQELDFAIRQRGNPADSAEAAQQLRRAVLAEMVRSELLAQSASASKLDSKDDWELAQKLARRQYLSTQVYLQAGRDAAQAAASEAETAMARQIPVLADRRLMTIEELQINNAPAGLLEQLETSLRRGAKLDELETLAEKSKATTTRGMRQVGSDQVTPEIRTQLLSAKPGQAIWTRPDSNRAIALLVRSSMPMPLQGAAAQQYVLEQLQAQTRNKEIQSRLQQASKDAKIEYFGEFAAKAAQ